MFLLAPHTSNMLSDLKSPSLAKCMLYHCTCTSMRRGRGGFIWLFFFFPASDYFSYFSMETSPLKSFSYANENKKMFRNLPFSYTREAQASYSKFMSNLQGTCPCRVTFLNLQDLLASLAPPVLHLPTTCPPGSL